MADTDLEKGEDVLAQCIALLSRLQDRWLRPDDWEAWATHQRSRGRDAKPLQLMTEWGSISSEDCELMLAENEKAKSIREAKRKFYTGAEVFRGSHWLREELSEASEATTNLAAYKDAIMDASGVIVISMKATNNNSPFPGLRETASSVMDKVFPDTSPAAAEQEGEDDEGY